MCRYLKFRRINIRELTTDTEDQFVRASARQAEVLGSNPSECLIALRIAFKGSVLPEN